MRPVIKVAFTDFWHGNSTEQILSNGFFKLLSRHYELELSNKPEILVYSCFGIQFLKYDCTRIFYTGENSAPGADGDIVIERYDRMAGTDLQADPASTMIQASLAWAAVHLSASCVCASRTVLLNPCIYEALLV